MDWLRKVAAVDGFDLSISSNSTALKRKNSDTETPNSVRKNHRSDDGLEGTRHLTVEQRHALLEPLGHFDFEEFSRKYPTVCEADYRLSLAKEEEEKGADDDDIEEDFSEYDSEYESECDSECESEDVEDSTDSLDYQSEDEFESNVLKRMEIPDCATEESPEFLDSLAKCTADELKIRSGKSLEHLLSGRIENRVDSFFNRDAFAKIHSGFLEKVAKDDKFVADKLAELEPVITIKSFSEIHLALVNFLYNLMVEMDNLYTSMFSVYNRCRSQPSLADVTSDMKRIRELKIEEPSTTIKDILKIYRVVDRVPECISRFSVTEGAVREAMKRIGADNYGPTPEFAEIINSQDYENNTLESGESHPSNTNVDNMSSEQIDKLQSVLKKLIQNKLK